MKVKNTLLLYSALIASAVMLTLIQPPFRLSLLAWVALVPFILVCSPQPVRDGRGSPAAKPFPLAVAAYLVSLCYWLANLYWLFPVTPLGWFAFCLYTALLWPLLAVALRFCRIKNIPLLLAVPVLFVGAERLQGLFLGGFFWRLLAHSQYNNITLIQIADIFGAAGVSFLIGMVNALVAELLIAASRRSPGISNFSSRLKSSIVNHKSSISVVCVALVATVAYGRWRVGQSDGFIEPGPLVAAVQSNVPQSVKQSFQASDAIFDELLHHSSAAAEAGAGLIVWPETMVQAILEPQVLRLLDSSHPYRIFDKAIREHSNQTAFVLVGAYGGTPQIQENFDIRLAEKYNSAFLYGNDGSQAYEQYSKIHLVPFGEFVPFKNSSPLLYNLLMRLTPYDYDYSLDAGKEYTVFKMAGDGQVYSFSVMICYEDAVPAIARRFTLNGQGQKRIDWLVNISNDGWFVRFKNGRVFPSTELAQHTAVCVFRAVENRLAVLRSVNTGISCLIDTVGRIKNGFLAGDLPNKAMDRTGCAGWFVDRVPLDKRTTFFSKYGQWLDFSCAGCLVLFIIVPPLGRSFRTEKIRNLFAGMPK